MRKIYLIFCMIMFAVFQAQIVNIPDDHLKSKLFIYGAASDSNGNFINIDTNGDGEIQVSEAVMVYKMTIFNLTDAITSLSGLNEFPNLRELTLDNPNISAYHLIFSNYPNLQKLTFLGGGVGNVTIENCSALNIANLEATGNIIDIQNTTVQEVKLENINGVNISSTPNLKKFSLYNSTISSLNLSNQPLLEEVLVSDNSLMTNINFAGDMALKKLELYRNKLSSLSIPNPSLVNYLSISFNLFQTFDVTPYTGLGRFLANDNQITSLDFSSSPLIGMLYIYNNNLNTLIFQNNQALGYLYANNNHITNNIAFNQTPYIKVIELNGNSLTNVDLSQNFFLLSAALHDNISLQTLNVKNGKLDQGIGFSNTSQLQYICTDPIENGWYNSLVSSINYNQPNVVVNSYCSLNPAGNYYVFQGVTRYDMNVNGCDVNDVIKPFQKFNILGQSTAISDAFGIHSLALTIGTNYIVPVLENPSYFNITPPFVNTNFPTQTSPLTQNFCLTANGIHNDLEMVILPVTIARPGFDAKYKIIYKNKGNTTQSGTLSFNYNDSLTDYLTSTVNPSSQSTGLLNWNFTNLLPFETREITVTLKLNAPTQNPALSNGDILHYTAQVNGATDEMPSDNTFTLNQTVVNSFDPNDKTCLEGTSITQAKVGDYVHYLIRFENTGTTNAQHVIVTDEIDTSKFDLASLITLSGSHNFVTRITGNTVEFIFENIQLPFDDANNDGYVSFKIKTKSTLNIGDSFSNTAKIYFDYNHPIITNTYTTSVQNTALATSEISKDNSSIAIYPNPVKDVLNIQSKHEILKADIYDSAGRILHSTSVKANVINVSELPKGNYIIKLSAKDKSFTQKFIKN
ncbi:hypothetical protein ASG22_04815 [Chryseobacterium sp. Leaf405]|uniref:T9SS type A sorting domain-containing protein n=1 Tax=Chryseobacterium sp. Leaf405 TaxID=1736367 RepID=UPI0006F26E53|nr:T9SS type A sorting domain-containing protein [Chryseobacterium sp. Leaf405]KQT26015.1 hypothetical protein ASG22_04815 [Chryseobacterium sp. Leaf405]